MKTKFTLTSNIQKLICKMEVLRYNIPCENVSHLFCDSEIDVVSMNKNGYTTEYEVKISYSDFKADAKKVKKWNFYNNKIANRICNYFYYVCPQNLININEIPKFAGLIYIENDNIVFIKKAKLIHKLKHDKNQYLTKISRILTERKYLGSCRFTYENKIYENINRTYS